MPNKTQNPRIKIYDLEERTARFAEEMIDFCRSLPKDLINSTFISQLIRSSSSIGANYMEADGAESKKDFQHKIAICKKESKESRHWLRLIAHANPEKVNECRNFWKEATELSLIFSSIIIKKKF